MQTRRNTWQILALAASVAVAPLVGCDTAAGVADRKVQADAVSTPVAYDNQAATEAITKLEALNKDAAMSAGRKAIAKSALASAEVDAARLVMNELQQVEAEISRTIWEMEEIAGQLRNIKTQVDSAKRRDPATPLPAVYQGESSVAQALARKAQAAREGDQPWVKGENAASLDNAATTKKKIDETQAKIDQIKGQIADLGKQRDAALADASKAQQEADAATGEEASRAFVRGADLRKQAAMLAIQIEGLEASLLPLNQDLAALKAHEEKANAAVAAIEAASKTYTDEYARVSKNADDMVAAARALLESDKDSFKAKGQHLNQLTAQAAELRSEAILKLQSAEAHYADAAKESDAVKRETKTDAPSDSPEATLASLAAKVHESATAQMRQAEALTLLATVHANHAALRSRQVQMQQYAGGSAAPLGLTVPSEAVDGKAEDDVKSAKESAETAFKQADGVLENVTSGATGSPAVRTAAGIQRAIVAAGLSYLAANTGDTAGADQHKQQALQYQREAESGAEGGGAGAMPVPAYLMVLTGTAPAAPAGGTTAPRTPAAPATPATPATPAAPATPDTPVEQPSDDAPVMNEK